MKRNDIVNFLPLLLIGLGAMILYTELPFYKEALLLIVLSMVVTTFLSERFIFLYTIIVMLGFGIFLISYAFIHKNQEHVQIDYMYIHVLLSAFLLTYWVLNVYVKGIVQENDLLQHKLAMLQRYEVHTHLLTLSEFKERAKILYQSAQRRNEQLWLLSLYIRRTDNRILQSVRERLGKIALESVRAEFDIVTANHNTIILLLQNTNEEGVQVVEKRIRQRTRAIFNNVEYPFYCDKQVVNQVGQITEAVKEGSS